MIILDNLDAMNFAAYHLAEHSQTIESVSLLTTRRSRAVGAVEDRAQGRLGSLVPRHTAEPLDAAADLPRSRVARGLENGRLA